MRNRKSNNFFAPQVPQSMPLIDLKETMRNIFLQQKKLEQNIAEIFNRPSRLINLFSADNILICLGVSATFLMFISQIADELITWKKNGVFIGYDTNFNGKIDEPGEREYGENIHNIAGASILFWLIFGTIIIKYWTDLNNRKQNPIIPIPCDDSYQTLDNQMQKLLEKLKEDLARLPIDPEAHTKKEALEKVFICPISRSLMCNPVEVWVEQKLSNGKVKEKAKIYDYMSFMRYAYHQVYDLKTSCLTDPLTTLQIKKITFSFELNKKFMQSILELENIMKTKLESNHSPSPR